MDSGDGLIPMTSPYGPGAIWGLFSGSWKPQGSDLRFGFDLLVLSKVIAANLIYTDPLGAAPDMSRFLFIDAALPVSWNIGPYELYAKPALLTRDGTWWVEATLGGAYHFRRITPITALAK